MLPIIGRFFPRFQLADVESGHWVISEKPEEFRKGECLVAIPLQVNQIANDIVAVVDFLQDKE